MGFHYKNGDYVGGCGAQIGGLVGVIVVGILASAGIFSRSRVNFRLGNGWETILYFLFEHMQ